MKSFKFFALLAIGVMCSALTQRRTQFELENNGYSGLLIAINDEILPSQDFLDGIERTWIDFSEALFNSTGRRAYFNQVVVSLPSTWDHFNFSNISSTSEFSSASSKQGIDWANVIVSERNPSFADAPYTKQTGECGEPGEYIHLTEKFVTDERYTKQAFGNVGKLLVREWGHLRWGLFDESGSSDQSPTKLFYHGMDGSLHPTRCSAQIRGKPQDAVTGGKCEIGLETDLPSDTCMFMPDRDQPEGVTGSVMFMHSLPQITEFCDDEPDTPAGRRHNSEAPNKHNAMCNGRSAWSVMRDHPDFKDGNNAAVPADVIKDVKPKFKYVVQRPKEIVFVIDVSTRENVDKTNEIRQAVGNYIMNQVPLGSKVGLVAFASEATQLSAMTSLRNESDRARLLTHLYNDTLLTEKYTTEERGKTSIGSGLSSAIAMISGGQGGGFSSGDASDSSDPRLTDICLSYLREQTFDASLLSQLPEDISAKDLLTICQSPFYKDQLISSSGGKFDPSDINGDGALISVACEYYSQNGKLSNDHLIKYLELYPKKSYSDLEDTCKAQLISGSGGDGISGNSGIEAIVRAACEHYLVNSDFTTEQILQLKKLFPERTAYKQLTELCEDPDLISGGAGGNGGGAGSSGSRDAMVKEACDYYRANEDFTAEQLFALKSAFPNRSLKEITELCADGELISGSDGEGGVNPSREAIVKEACDYYSLNSDFTTKQYESLKQLYPERTTFKQLTELCDNELISGLDGEGGSDPSGEATVKLACEYYSVNSDFTTKQMEDLKRLYPDRTSFKQLAELCKNDELISGDSGDSKPSDSEIVKRACEYYAVHKDFTREQATDLMEKFTDLSFNELPSLCSDSDLISGDSGDSNPSESEIVKQACEYYAVHKDFTRDQINDLMDKFTDLSFNELPSLCSDSGGGNGAKITLEASCVEYKEEGKLNLKTIENEFKMNLMQFMSKCDEIYPPSSRKRRQSRAVQSELAEKCAEWKEHLDSTDDETDAVYQIVKQSYERDCIENDRVKRSEKSEKCSELEKQLDDAEDSGNDFLVELLKEKLQTDCVEIERVKRSEKSEKCWGLEKELETAEKNGNDIIVEVLKEKIQADCVEEIERVKREEKNDKCIQMEKELEDAKAIGSAEFVLEMIRDKIQTDCAELHRRIIRAAESAECRELKVRFEDAVKDGDAFLEKTFKENFNSKCKEVKRTERDAKSDECEQLEKELEDAKARNKPEFMLQMIEDKIQTDCVEEYERLKRTAKSEECLALEKELADAEATGKTFLVQILKENIKTTCTEDSSESGGSGAACAKQQEDLDKAMRQGVEDYLLDVLRRALLDCKAHNTEESSGGSVATACAKQQDALDKVISQGGDESLIDVLQKALLDCKAEYTENEAGSKDNTCATLSSAIDGLSQTVKTDPSPANQESLRSLTASFRTLGCTGNQNADSDYGNYGAISGKNAHEIVLITSYQDSMDVESTITDVDTKGLQEAGVSLTVVHARQFSYIQLMRVINYNNATLFDLSLEKGSNLKGTPGSLFTLQSQDLDAKSAMILQKQVTLNKPFKNLDAETNKTMPIAKFESFNNITTVTVDGGKFLRVIFALDISRLTAKDRVQYPAITVKAPFAPVKGRKSGSQSSFSFSPDSYKDGESDVVKKFNETNTVRFMIPLEGRKAIGNWTITVFEDLSKPEISGQLLVDIPASNPLVIDPPKENKKSTASEPTNENTENEAETEAEKAKRSSELFMEDDIIPESKSEDVGAELQSPVELMDDDEATSEDAEMDPKAARAKLIQKHLDEKNGPIVRLSGKIVEEKRSKMKKVVAELTWGDYHAILDAEVKVMFECGTAGDKTNTRNKDETSRTITLLDNGANGDVTAGDGVYSGFFVYTSKMRCSGRLVATGVQGGPQHLRDLGRVSTVDMAPGVIFTREAEQTVPAFRRELVLESFDNSAGQTTSEVDKIAPARVIDLALVDSSLSKRTVQMKFTRSGDDLDKVTIGKMVQYDIRISANLTEMYLNFDSCFQLKPEHLVDTRIMPDFTTPYTLPMFTFTVPEDVWLQSTSKVFAVGLRANDTLNSSPVSNVVIVALKDPPTTFVPVFIAALLLIAFILLSTLFYVVRRAARKSANSQGKIYIHVPNLNKKRGMGGKMGGHGRKGGSQEVDIESMPKLNTTSQVCVDSY
ncbi:uncharacterized protein LOC134854903 isoform X22 [Symsagittifera roscoffensis]|uniref:uncharacterized protein LOC134854903 isoform X22 n=1 Tax=Symsagittifera roscoffensis TaxID=84072 RepID=UPI00307BD46A